MHSNMVIHTEEEVEVMGILMADLHMVCPLLISITFY